MDAGAPFKFPCPICAQRIAALPADVGTTGGCPGCGSQFLVPNPGVPVVAGEKTGRAAKRLPLWKMVVGAVVALGVIWVVGVALGVIPFRLAAPPPVPATAVEK